MLNYLVNIHFCCNNINFFFYLKKIEISQLYNINSNKEFKSDFVLFFLLFFINCKMKVERLLEYTQILSYKELEILLSNKHYIQS